MPLVYWYLWTMSDTSCAVTVDFHETMTVGAHAAVVAFRTLNLVFGKRSFSSRLIALATSISGLVSPSAISGQVWSSRERN